MVKNRTTEKRQHSATTSSNNTDGVGNNVNYVRLNDGTYCNNDGGGHERERNLGWASIPGTKLHVDIANMNDVEHSKKKKKKRTIHSSSNHINDKSAAADQDEEEDDEKYETSKWKSYHYDNEELNDDTDLYNPDRLDNSNKFDVGGLMEGANDAGMFLSLEVIPGDAYKVEKSGDDKSGFVTKVVFTTKSKKDLNDDDDDGESKLKKNNGEEGKIKNKKRAKRQDDECSKNKSTDDENIDLKPSPTPTTDNKTGADVEGSNDTAATLSKKERQKLKRKAKQKLAKERKRLKREQEESNVSTNNKSVPVASTSSSVALTSAHQDTNNNDLSQTQTSQLQQQQEQQTASEAITQLQTTWSIAAPGISLHNTLCQGLHTLQYTYPTPIQAATLPAAILGRRDIVGAAPTGSGKTLSYGLPILQYLLDCNDNDINASGNNNTTVANPGSNIVKISPLQALILTPTRELALQVTSELQRVCCNVIKIGTIVGGFAEVKQRRTLEKVRPPILVATPGRLWELMSSKEYTHLNNLTQLRFVVVDEADRMIKQGNFPQLKQIFEVVNQANPPPPDDDSDDESDSEDDDDDNDGYDRMKSLAGIRGEAKVVMLSDSILEAIERERAGGGSVGVKGGTPKPMEMDDDEYEEQAARLLQDDDDSDLEEEEETEQPLHRQTFVYSATLTLPPSMHHLIKKDPSSKKKKGKGRKRQPTTVDGAISEILDVAGARGELKIVDLSNTIPEGKKGKCKKTDSSSSQDNNTAKNDISKAANNTRLPAGLTLGEIPCAQRHKDSHLYAYLVTTLQGSSGPCLVFCNSIAAVRRVGETLKMLGLPVKMLHAQMPQKSRLGALESLRTSNSRSIVVASDVAARGLDIPSVTTVIHYDVARVIDTFIHRSGRTARGVGEKAVGTSVSLVAPAEEREHQKICEAVLGSGSKSLEKIHIDGRLLNEAQERVALATKIVSCNDVETQVSRKNKWLQDAAASAGLDLDEDMMEGGLLDGDKRDRQRFIEAKRAKGELRQLLATPMRKQHFGKFLSGAGLRESIKAESEVKPYLVQKQSKGKHKRKNGSKKQTKI